MKLTLISLISLAVSGLLCYSCLFTARTIARTSLVKAVAVFDDN